MDVPVRVQVRIKPPTNSKSENDEKYDKDSILVKLSSTKVKIYT
jgi:hypothetical protein